MIEIGLRVVTAALLTAYLVTAFGWGVALVVVIGATAMLLEE